MQTFFKIVLNNPILWSYDSDDDEIIAKVKSLNEQDPELVIAQYSSELLKKFKYLAGCT